MKIVCLSECDLKYKAIDPALTVFIDGFQIKHDCLKGWTKAANCIITGEDFSCKIGMGYTAHASHVQPILIPSPCQTLKAALVSRDRRTYCTVLVVNLHCKAITVSFGQLAEKGGGKCCSGGTHKQDFRPEDQGLHSVCILKHIIVVPCAPRQNAWGARLGDWDKGA